MKKEIILTYLIDYLKTKVSPFKIDNKRGVKVTCPICKKNPPLAFIIPQHQLNCVGCNKNYGDIINMVRLLEPEKKDWQDGKIINYLVEFLKIKDTSLEIGKMLEKYKELGFSLVPIARNQKNPIEKDWTNKTHKDIYEWEEWIENGLNIGVKCGKDSGITVIDIDQKPIPKEIQNILDKYKPTFVQETTKGFHLFYQNNGLPTTRIDDLKIDILNDGKQCVIYPSIVDEIARNFKDTSSLEKIPDELYRFLESKVTVSGSKSHSELLKEEIANENFKINPDDFKLKNNGLQGCCNDSFVKLGGILVKRLSTEDTGFVLRILNKHLLEDPMTATAINGMINSLSRYAHNDEKELANKILHYLRIVEEANSRDIREALGDKTPDSKQKIEKALSYLVKEGFIIKKRRNFILLKKADWKDTFLEEGKPINWEMPYFHDIAHFREGDMIVIGGKTGTGKTHIAMNIIKRLIPQGIKPNYISLESGNRFASIAQQLSIPEGSFNWCVHYSPENIELEDNSVTLLDWLLPKDYAETDKVYEHFSKQLTKHGGILIIFCQLRKDGRFFAEDMINFFPALSIKFLYLNEEDTTNSKFESEKIREAKGKQKVIIPTIYDSVTKELLRVDEIPSPNLGANSGT